MSYFTANLQDGTFNIIEKIAALSEGSFTIRALEELGAYKAKEYSTNIMIAYHAMVKAYEAIHTPDNLLTKEENNATIAPGLFKSPESPLQV
jgi:hypothetical protein